MRYIAFHLYITYIILCFRIFLKVTLTELRVFHGSVFYLYILGQVLFSRELTTLVNGAELACCGRLLSLRGIAEP